MSKKIKLGIVGLNFGRWIVHDLIEEKNPYVEIKTICDLDHAALDPLVEKYKLHGTTSMDDILNDPEIDVVGLYTGPERRAALLRKILNAGKDIMTTKPFELDAVEAEKVLREAKAKGRILHLNSPSPIPTGEMETISQWISKYDLGKPVGCRADVWANYFEKADGKWMDDPKRCPMAPIFRLGIYLINDLVRILGDVEDVNVLGSRIRTERPTVDNAQLGILFKNGAIGNVYGSFCVNDGDHYSNSLTINFERGTIYRNAGLIKDRGEKNEGADIGIVMSVDGKRKIVEQRKFPNHSGNYLWDYLQKAVNERIVIDDAYIADIVAGVRIVGMMIESQDAFLARRK